ncbi:hypothetical protein AB4225_34540, partial [Streptomyces sp. 2RAF24]
MTADDMPEELEAAGHGGSKAAGTPGSDPAGTPRAGGATTTAADRAPGPRVAAVPLTRPGAGRPLGDVPTDG